MKRMAFITLIGIIFLALAYQLWLINSKHAGLSEPTIICLALTSEFVLMTAAIILLINSKSLQMKLRESEHLYDTLFKSTNTGIATFDLDGRIVKVNSAIGRLLGYNATEMHSMDFYSIIQRKNINELQSQMNNLIEKKIHSYQTEQQCVHQNDELVWVMLTLSLMRDANNKPVNFIVQLQDISAQKNAEEELQHLAYHDPLTGLANRNRLEQFSNHILSSARRQQTGFAVLFMDLDQFKNINDTIGHEAGDILLQIIAERLHKTVRATDIVARLGGDEFIILITDVKQMDAVVITAQKILESVMEVVTVHHQQIYITTSIGISLYPGDGKNIEMLMKHADLALYRAKENGRNNYQFFTHEMTGKAQEKLSLQNALGQALAKNEFLLNYQPKLDIKAQRITGVEALLRWRNAEYSAVTPAEIIGLAEESGLIIPVSEWVLNSACQQLKEWQQQGKTALTMAINCSSKQFKQATFVDNIRTMMTRADIPADFLEIEINESIVMDDPENILRMLYALKDLGVKIVVDNFGTGYWSLNNLRKLSIDKIKIDKSFIKQITIEETSAAITTAILAMANKLGIKSVAEGVETKEQYEFLAKEGCGEIQGYYLSRPLPAELMTVFLNNPVPVLGTSKLEVMS